jgi:stage II sporulation protein D
LALTVLTSAAQTPDPRDAAIAASAYSIIDLPSRRTLDEQRGEWLDAPVWPGSIAKLATYTAAIDAGTLTEHTHILCTRRVMLRDGRRADCSHPPIATALSLREAVAMSCNVFAAEVARSLTSAQLAAGFVRLGFPSPASALGGDQRRPDPHDPRDQHGQADQIAIAIGLDGARVPPRQLLQALIRVVQGGDDRNAATRELLRDGLRDSARSGTASAFGRAGIDAFAKTGTASMRNGRALGLVVALAPATSPRLGIVVALPGGAGADAADVAVALLQRRLAEITAPSVAASTEATTEGPGPIRIGVPMAKGYRVESVPLEEYVARVVAGETSSATPQAAREALAITARTFALANRGRHAADGFDLCTLTHCQVLRPASAATHDAAARTRGRVLTQPQPQAAAAAVAAAPSGAAATPAKPPALPAMLAVPAAVFYSAACGGQLEDASVLLPNTRPGAIAWMTSRPDPAGVEEPGWRAELSAVDLLKALHASGVRGEVLRDLRVQTNASGRATSITLTGLTPSTLDADDFRRIIGQRLGWQWLKSPRFTAERTARGYRFEGRGHGHGVGLCVFGASALARRGKSAEEILRLYFPGLEVADAASAARTSASTAVAARASAAAPTAARGAAPADAPVAATAPPTVSLRLPVSEERERAALRSRVEQDLRELTNALAVDANADAAATAVPRRVTLVVHPTVESYRRATGRPWWTSAATTFDAAHAVATVHFVPLGGLRRTVRLDATIRHELVHVLTDAQLRARPLWVREGIAAHFAGERIAMAEAEASAPAAGVATATGAAAADAACPADAEFARARTPEAFQDAYARAATCVAREMARGVSWRAIGRRD